MQYISTEKLVARIYDTRSLETVSLGTNYFRMKLFLYLWYHRPQKNIKNQNTINKLLTHEMAIVSMIRKINTKKYMGITKHEWFPFGKLSVERKHDDDTQSISILRSWNRSLHKTAAPSTDRRIRATEEWPRKYYTHTTVLRAHVRTTRTRAPDSLTPHSKVVLGGRAPQTKYQNHTQFPIPETMRYDYSHWYPCKFTPSLNTE